MNITHAIDTHTVTHTQLTHTNAHTNMYPQKERRWGKERKVKNCETLNLQMSDSHRTLGNMETWLFAGLVPRFLARASE